MEAIQCRQAQRVDAADDRGIDQLGAQHALRGGEYLGARGAGGAERPPGRAGASRATHVVRDRERIVACCVVEVRGQRPGEPDRDAR